MRSRSIPLVILTLALLSAAGCATAGPAASPNPTGSELTPGPSMTPSPSTPPSSATLPTECAQVNTQGLLDQLTLQGDGLGFVRPAPANAKLALGCDWIEGDATGYLLLISTTDAASADAYVQTLPADGWTCGVRPDDAGQMCTLTTANTQFPADTVETIVSHGDVWIYQSATNVDGNTLLADLTASIWQS